MFECTQCHKTFTRKDSLLRHIKTLHPRSDVRDFSPNNQFENTSGDYLFNPFDKQILSDVGNKTLSVQNELLESNYDADVTGRNNSDEDISQKLQDNSENYIAEKGLNPFDQRVRAATEAIKSKFNTIRQSRNTFQNYGGHTPVSENQEDTFMKIRPKNNNAAVFESKLPELLQCALDILLIKELQNVDTRDKDDEIGDGENKNIKLKRKFNEQGNDDDGDEINSPEETPLKHLKYDYSMERKNGNDNNLINSECTVKKYWHNPNTLVNELRNLITTTDVGQQISIIIRRLNENNNIKSANYFEYVKHEADRNELIRNLNELKKTDIGQEIFCILHELEKAEIIEAIDYFTNEEEEGEEEDEDDNTINEDVMTGKGLIEVN